MSIGAILFASGRKDWGTPPGLFARLHARHAFTLDVCARADNAVCERFLSPEQDGLASSWAGERCFMNPPYGRGVGAWIAKAASGEADLVCALLPARTDTAWWHDHVQARATSIEFLRGRLRFVGAEGSAPFPSVIVTWLAALTPRASAYS